MPLWCWHASLKPPIKFKKETKHVKRKNEVLRKTKKSSILFLRIMIKLNVDFGKYERTKLQKSSWAHRIV